MLLHQMFERYNSEIKENHFNEQCEQKYCLLLAPQLNLFENNKRQPMHVPDVNFRLFQIYCYLLLIRIM